MACLNRGAKAKSTTKKPILSKSNYRQLPLPFYNYEHQREGCEKKKYRYVSGLAWERIVNLKTNVFANFIRILKKLMFDIEFSFTRFS